MGSGDDRHHMSHDTGLLHHAPKENIDSLRAPEHCTRRAVLIARRRDNRSEFLDCNNQPQTRMDKLLIVRVCSASELVNSDLTGKTDPFCVITVNDRDVGETSVKNNTQARPDQTAPRSLLAPALSATG